MTEGKGALVESATVLLVCVINTPLVGLSMGGRDVDDVMDSLE